MASVNDNVNAQRPNSVGRSSGAGGAGRTAAPAVDTPKTPVAKPETPAAKPKTPTDQALIAVRPQTEAERQQTILQAVKAAQAASAPATEKTETESETPTGKKIADGVGFVDAVKEGAKIATSSDEIARLPVVGKAVQSGSRLGKFFTAIAESRVGQAIGNALKTNRYVAPAVRFLGRIAPIAGAGVAIYDINDAVKTNKNPKASTAEKVLATTKGVLSGVAGVAGLATLVLAPTGVGAAIAGGVALGAGLISLGADLALGRVRKNREEAEKAGK